MNKEQIQAAAESDDMGRPGAYWLNGGEAFAIKGETDEEWIAAENPVEL